MSRSHRYRWAADRQVLVPKEAFMEPTNELVYIVDDEASVGEALTTLLRANRKRVQIFTSGQDFLDFARRDSCACLILDLKMPGLGGLEVQKLISAKTSIPVIFLTGRGDIPSTVRAMKGGAVDFSRNRLMKKRFSLQLSGLWGKIARAVRRRWSMPGWLPGMNP
jgi:FixJ family two-component response regulator